MRLTIVEKDVALCDDERLIVERRMRFALTRFAPAVKDVSVTLTDESGPHGSPAKRCKVVIGLRGTGEVVVDATDDGFEMAASRAADRAGRTVARQLERKRHYKRYQRRRSNREWDGVDLPVENTRS